MPSPADEVPITPDVVAALLAEQHPDLAHLPLGRRYAGWDMAMYRLGEDLAVRLPRRAAAVGSMATELRWVRELGTAWTFPTQQVVRAGEPGAAYPWPWAVVTWLPGATAAEVPLDASAGADLGRALTQVHVPAAPDAPYNDEQSVPLSARVHVVLRSLAHVEEHAPARGLRLDRERAERLWADALAAPVDVPRTWIHADLHPYNLLSVEGRFAGVLDWADIAEGDRATDLGFLWLVLPAAGVRAAFDAYGGLSDATTARAHGTGLALAAGWVQWDETTTREIGWRALTELGVLRPA
ncbi:aminoglycoside phosphotransferase family protein [Cellulomonas dongxiuzhuiae]|uniref:Aminoglycoside phosphotransferase family protein n=1 Tax=Cellulomonas dongxiuzhuiae TaxID=2819979 RepID=A0ABX8GI23_9CELL|nr:aminoglycoside phosphotransferase family protein [Cellulomonas dongxiuzhuiae]MBO3094821.1 aminoglycoside phosphotransferase family protein [Cellulomonas dongxiuzhuiae]QWC15854.1 aminoglycoside phosphotransferase family protein [Cellulomonas dongxiuzhuiae]